MNISEWPRQRLARWRGAEGADLRSAPAVRVAASAQALEWEIWKFLNGFANFSWHAVSVPL